jgi:ergothioneine biosynthesis protein EgtB
MSLLEEYTRIREHTIAICAPLAIEDHVPQPADFVSPPKWHLAHSTWFFEQMILKRFQRDFQEYDPQFGYLFNSYYNHVGERTARVQRGHITRPTLQEVLAYRAHTDKCMLQLLRQAALAPDCTELIELGLHHEQQHQELLYYDLKYILGQQPLFPAYGGDTLRHKDRNAVAGWIDMPAGIYEIGWEGDGFSFDNERNRHKVYLQSYQISKALVTNAEYLSFIQDGGYSRFELWLDEGWAWVKENAAKCPLYWQQRGADWLIYGLDGLQPLEELSVLTHINYYEAQAFATWAGKRLPTEAEWEAASDQLPWGARWEWTGSAYLPYPGFKIAPGAVGEYNGKFMVNQMVLRGASVATPAGHARTTYRNFFHPHLQWQFAGIRLAT